MGIVIMQTALLRPFSIKEHACSMYPLDLAATVDGNKEVVCIYGMSSQG